MSENSAISWTHHTFNPWWGCVRVSAGCERCYAETFAKRIGLNIWGPAKTTPRRLFGEKHWAEPLRWNEKAEAAGERHRVFCASMADVFEDHPDVLDARQKLWELIERTPMLDWLLLTKRPENLWMLPGLWQRYPRENVWLGTSVEDQAAAETRIPLLVTHPAAVHFLSAEPLLGSVNLSKWTNYGAIDWVIAGGESGAGFRPMDPDWARSLRDQCQAAGVAFHFKQVGGLHHAAGGRLLDGDEWSQYPVARALVPAR